MECKILMIKFSTCSKLPKFCLYRQSFSLYLNMWIFLRIVIYLFSINESNEGGCCCYCFYIFGEFPYGLCTWGGIKMEKTEEKGEIPKLIEKKKWLPTTLTTSLTLIAILWALFFYGWLDLQIPLYFSIWFPFMLLFLYITLKFHSLYKFLWIISIGIVFAGIIWFGIGFLVVGVFSTPLPEFYVLFIPPSLAIGCYLAFRWGKRRDFRPYMW